MKVKYVGNLNYYTVIWKGKKIVFNKNEQIDVDKELAEELKKNNDFDFEKAKEEVTLKKKGGE